MGVFSALWDQMSNFLDAAVPVAAQVALVYLIVRFAVAVAATIAAISVNPRPAPQAAAAAPAPAPAAPAEAEPPSTQELLEQAGASGGQGALPGASQE